MYAARYNLVHGGFDDMTPQEMWNNLKNIEKEINCGSANFLNSDWKKHALEAIADMRFCKSDLKRGEWKDKMGNIIMQ